MQNIYKSSRKIRIRWLSQDKNNGEIYSPDFYDYIDFDCILTNLNLNKIDKNKFQLTKIELLRTENILKRAIDVEAGVSEKPRVTEEHPDGLDLSLYKDESQLKKKKKVTIYINKNKVYVKKTKRTESFSEDDAPEDESGKKSPKSNRSKKRTVNKALAIAKSVAKGSSRAERALNRNTKSGSEITATNSTTTTTVTTSTTSIDVTKNNTDIKRSENKKSTKQQNNNNTSGVSRTKLRASAQNTQSNKTAGRPKRMAAATGIVSTEETIRKKPRGRA
uniref:Uncharacterized protein n=1 Tax=Apis cerana TaxID=7461 RepID=V9IDU9_APICE